jgi:hypothetical protein
VLREGQGVRPKASQSVTDFVLYLP